MACDLPDSLKAISVAQHLGELALALLTLDLEVLHRLERATRIDPMCLPEIVGDEVHQTLVPVLAAEIAVAVGGELCEFVRRDTHDRDVEGPAT